jgi:hypothetical protein
MEKVSLMCRGGGVVALIWALMDAIEPIMLERERQVLETRGPSICTGSHLSPNSQSGRRWWVCRQQGLLASQRDLRNGCSSCHLVNLVTGARALTSKIF